MTFETEVKEIESHHFDNKVLFFGVGHPVQPSCRINFSEAAEANGSAEPPPDVSQIRQDQTGRQRIRQNVSVGRSPRRQRRGLAFDRRVVKRRRRFGESQLVDDIDRVDDFKGNFFVDELTQRRLSRRRNFLPEPLFRRRREKNFRVIRSGAPSRNCVRRRSRNFPFPFPAETAEIR